MFRLSHKRISDEETIKLFEQEIKRQEDIIYGVALFFECVSLLHANQPSVVETYKKQFRNIIQKGTDMVTHANAALEEARTNKKKIKLLSKFRFSPCEGHPNPGAMAERAEKLVTTYKRVFPERPRERDFEPDEILKLLEKAALNR